MRPIPGNPENPGKKLTTCAPSPEIPKKSHKKTLLLVVVVVVVVVVIVVVALVGSDMLCRRPLRGQPCDEKRKVRSYFQKKQRKGSE